MRCKAMLISLVVILIFGVNAFAVVVYEDTFTDAALGLAGNAGWTLDEAPDAHFENRFYTTHDPGNGRIYMSNVYNDKYAHLQKDLPEATGQNLKLSAIVAQWTHTYDCPEIGMGIGIWFDNDNWIKVSQSIDKSAGSDYNGYLVHHKIGGVETAYNAGPRGWGANHTPMEIELTDTQVIFRGTGVASTYPAEEDYQAHLVDMYHDTPYFTMERPDTFFGSPILAIGKMGSADTDGITTGIAGDISGMNPDFDNNMDSIGTQTYHHQYITYARIEYVPEPASVILMGLGGMLIRYRKKTRN